MEILLPGIAKSSDLVTCSKNGKAILNLVLSTLTSNCLALTPVTERDASTSGGLRTDIQPPSEARVDPPWDWNILEQ